MICNNQCRFLCLPNINILHDNQNALILSMQNKIKMFIHLQQSVMNIEIIGPMKAKGDTLC
jgi:hypothetical protein